ncbi:MAG TPA: MFS transporter [Chthonomonadaceae bacterium]|nr:MFS transporter [Chthonomonadaceae bacterium]
MDDPARRLAGNCDFGRLWAARAVSDFGSMVSRTALSFTAILYLKATPGQLGLLLAVSLAPRLVAGPVAGVLADRMPRRTLMVGADIGRALLLATVPAAALVGRLTIAHLILVTALAGALGLLFDVASGAYLPAIVPAPDLIGANSRLTATAAVAEFGAFSIGGWLVQWFTAPFAVLIDAITFLFSAGSLGLIRAKETAPAEGDRAAGAHARLRDGFAQIVRDPVLASLAGVTLLMGLGGGIEGAVMVAFMTRVLQFPPGPLGLIWSVGGIASLVGARYAERIARRVGPGPALAGALLIVAAGIVATGSARGPTLGAAVLLILNQLSDAAYAVFEILKASLVQSIVPGRLLGRIHGLFETVAVGAMLAGALIGGMLGERPGLRFAVCAGAFCFADAALVAMATPVRRARVG